MLLGVIVVIMMQSPHPSYAEDVPLTPPVANKSFVASTLAGIYKWLGITSVDACEKSKNDAASAFESGALDAEGFMAALCEKDRTLLLTSGVLLDSTAPHRPIGWLDWMFVFPQEESLGLELHLTTPTRGKLNDYLGKKSKNEVQDIFKNNDALLPTILPLLQK